MTPSQSLMAPCERPAVFLDGRTYRQHKNQLKTPHFLNQIPLVGNVFLPLNVDSEWEHQALHDVFDVKQKAQKRRVVTVQVGDALNQHPQIFAHPDLIAYAQQTGRSDQVRHPIFESECVIIEYLKTLGYDAHLTYDSFATKRKRTLTVTLYGFFLLVDLLNCFQGLLLAWILDAIKQKRVVHQRNLKYVRRQKDPRTFRLPYTLTLDHQSFALVLDFADLVGAQGKVSLHDFCANVGLPMASKDLAGVNISRMLAWYFENPEDYDRYALGDLCLYPAWKLYNQTIEHLSGQMAGIDRAVMPALTVGSSTNRVVDAMRLKHLDLAPDASHSDFYHQCLGRHVFRSLDDQDHPANTLLKVDGGRCRNNAPRQALLNGALCDLDVKGAYASAMMTLYAFFGGPTIVTFDNTCLKDVLKIHQQVLRPHHWAMRISTCKPLSFVQDLISSFYNYKWNALKADSESYHETGEFDHDSGAAKIFSRLISEGTLTSDLLDVILHAWSPAAREEFLSCVRVKSLAYYDPQFEVTDVKEFVKILRQHDNKIKEVQAHNKSIVESGVDQPRLTPPPALNVWHKLPLRDLGIEAFREERKKHPKSSALNILYKLLGNTAYGAIVSHYFPAHNPITANNITANVRAAIYVAEKGLGFRQTITDGGLFDLNGVLTPKRKGRVYTDKLFDVLSLSKRDLDRKLDLKFSGLGGHRWDLLINSQKIISVRCDGQEVDMKLAHHRVNTLCLEHLQNLFPDLPLLQSPYLEFELKDFFTKATFHGSSNYAFWQGDVLKHLKMRGFERKAHCGYDWCDSGTLMDDPIYQEGYSPARFILEELARNPEAVSFAPPFLKHEILKTACFANHYDTRCDGPITPGDNLVKMGCARWFSLNQFTFLTLTQLDHWQKARDKLLRQYGLSFELFFLNEDSTLNFNAMIRDIHDLIQNGLGCDSTDEILYHFDPHRHRERLFKQHPILERRKRAVDAMKARLITFYHMADINTGNTSFDDTFEMEECLDDIDEFDLK